MSYNNYNQPPPNQPPGNTPPPRMPNQPVGSNPNDKTLSLLPHLLMIFTGFIAPLVMYIMFKDKPGAVKDNSREALNFSLVVLLSSIALTVVTFVLAFVSLGLLSFLTMLIYIPFVIGAIFNIIATIKVNEVGFYKYPVNYELVK